MYYKGIPGADRDEVRQDEAHNMRRAIDESDTVVMGYTR